MHVLSSNVLEKAKPNGAYTQLADYVSLQIELGEYEADVDQGVYNSFTHCCQLYPRNAAEVYQDQMTRLSSELTERQECAADRWLAVYRRGSEVKLEDEATKVGVSFRRIYWVRSSGNSKQRPRETESG